MRSIRSSTWLGIPVSAGTIWGNSESCSRKGVRYSALSLRAVTANEVGLKEHCRNRQRSRRLTLDAVVKRAADNGQIALAERKQPVLDMTVGGARTKVQNLEVSVPVHSHTVPVILGQKQHVDRTRRVERPDVNSLRIDLRFNNAEVISGKTAWARERGPSQVPSRNWLVLPISVLDAEDFFDLAMADSI